MAHVPAKSKTMTIKFTPDQHRMMNQRAARCGVKLTVWIRSIVLQAASRQASEGYLRIKEPDGATT